MKTMHLLFWALLGSAFQANALAAQVPAAADAQLPPALRNRPPAPPATAGAALRAQALAKLEAQFQAADLDGNGRLSREEAKRFGFVAAHFDAIDRAGLGAVGFEDLRSYLEQQEARRR